MDIFKKEVEKLLRKYGVRKIKLEKPPQEIKADLAFPCFDLAKKLKKSPQAITKEIAEKIKPVGVIKKVEAKGGYVNFYFDWQKLGQLILKKVLKEKEKYGSCKEGKNILIEYTSANPDGPLHIGHFRNSCIGDSLARILKFCGNKVITEFYVNDTGRQIAIAVLEYLKSQKLKIDKKRDWFILDLYLKGNSAIEKNPAKEKEVKELIKACESGNSKIVKNFAIIVDNCIRGQKETLTDLGIKIDSYKKESKYLLSKQVNKILARIKSLPQAKVKGKRIWLDLKEFGIEREFILTRSDGTTIYPARDLAYHQDKFSRADFNINVIGTDQKFYFKQLLTTLSLLFPAQIKNYKIVFYEFLLTSVGSMSTRLGKFISVDELIDKAIKAAREIVAKKMPDYTEKLKEKIAKAVGVGALKYAMLKVTPEKTYSFGIADILKFEGDTAPYIQYTYARACSILRKSKARVNKFNANLLKNELEKAVIKKLSEFPSVIEKASKDLRPHYVANYAYKLADYFNEFYQFLPVIKSEKNMMQARLALTLAVAIVLKNCLQLLGIEALERM